MSTAALRIDCTSSRIAGTGVECGCAGLEDAVSSVVTVEAPSETGAWACTGTQEPQDDDADPGVS